VDRVLEIMMIPTDCPIRRDAGMIDFHLYIALLCLQYDENTNPLLMFLHDFRIDLVIFLLCCCYPYCSKRVYSILFSVIFKHEIKIFMLDGVHL
jgi:hypothetical protein